MKRLLAFLLAGVLLMSMAMLTGCAERNEAGLKWWQKTNAYEIYVKSFKDSDGDGIGDLKGVTSELDHLKSLGVGAVWLTPVYRSPQADNGYDIADYYQIDEMYGTMEDMDELIREAKERDIRIIMDLVFNHTSDQHPWFLESMQSRDNAKADWYVWRDPKPDGSAPTNWRSIFGGSAWTWSEERQQYYLHTFLKEQPDLNWENPEVRQALYDVANFWTEKGVGGFRMDAVTYIKKPAVFQDGTPDAADGMVGVHSMTANTDGILDYLREFRENVQAGKDIFTVGEANGVAARELPQWVGADGVFDMIFEFSHINIDLPDESNWCETRDWKLTDLKKCLSDTQASTKDGWCPIFFENHDQSRSVNHFFPDTADPETGGSEAMDTETGGSENMDMETMDPEIKDSENMDTAAMDTETGSSKAMDPETKAKAKVLGTVLLTLRGTPFLYQGEELGMTNVGWDSIEDYNDISTINHYKFALESGYSEEECMKAVQRFSRDNARTPMQWTDDAHAGFTDGTPWLPAADNYKECNVKAENADPDSVLSWYRQLVQLKRERPELVEGDYEELMKESEQVYAYRRDNGRQSAAILVNFSGEEAPYDPALTKGAKLLLSSAEGPHIPGVLQPYEAAVYAGK